MKKAPPTLTKLESSSAAFRHPGPENRGSVKRAGRRVLASLRRHFVLAVSISLLILLAGSSYLYLHYIRNFYAESILYVTPGSPEVLPGPGTVTLADNAYDPHIGQVVNNVTRPDVLIGSIHQLPNSYFRARSDQAKAEELGDSLVVARIPNTSEVRIGLRGSNAQRISDIVKKVTQVYLAGAQQDELVDRNRAIDLLQKEGDQLKLEMIARQGEQSQLLQSLGIAAFNPNAPNPFNERITKLTIDLVSARERLHAAESELAAFEADDQARSRPIDAVHQVEASDRTLILQSRDYENKVAHDLASAEADAAAVAPKFQQLLNLTNALSRDVDRAQAIEDRIANLNMGTHVPGSVRLFSATKKPELGGMSKACVLLLLWILISVVAGVCSAILRDLMARTLHSPEDIEQAVGLPPAGILFDRDEVSAKSALEYASRLGATLDHARRTASVRSFAFTAIKAESEQDTTMVVNLVANEMALLGNRVLVIDIADQRDPVAFIPPDQDQPRSNPRPRLLHPELDLQAGSRGRNLPSIGHIVDSFRRVHGDFDALILDCPPLLLSADTEYQVRQADATLLIVEAGTTKKADLVRASRLLDRLRIPGLAIILNKLHLDRAGDELRNDVKTYELSGQRSSAFCPPGYSVLGEGETSGLAAPKVSKTNQLSPKQSRRLDKQARDSGFIKKQINDDSHFIHDDQPE